MYVVLTQGLCGCLSLFVVVTEEISAHLQYTMSFFYFVCVRMLQFTLSHLGCVPNCIYILNSVYVYANFLSSPNQFA